MARTHCCAVETYLEVLTLNIFVGHYFYYYIIDSHNLNVHMHMACSFTYIYE